MLTFFPFFSFFSSLNLDLLRPSTTAAPSGTASSSTTRLHAALKEIRSSTPWGTCSRRRTPPRRPPPRGRALLLLLLLPRTLLLLLPLLPSPPPPAASSPASWPGPRAARAP